MHYVTPLLYVDTTGLSSYTASVDDAVDLMKLGVKVIVGSPEKAKDILVALGVPADYADQQVTYCMTGEFRGTV